MSALRPPIEPMLAKIATELPREPGFLFEPKWDGFRALVFRGNDSTYLQSRDLKPLNRYFPELEKALHEALPRGCVLDGEIVVADAHGLDFDALQQRIHPAASRIARLARETPASFVAFDLLAAGGKSTMALPQSERRVRLERLLGKALPPLYLTPATRDRDEAVQWLERFEGAGLDGVVAKLESAAYQPARRAMLKIKHARTADCVVGGFRWYKDRRDAIGSLLLGLYDGNGVLQHVGVASSFTMEMRQALLVELEPLRKDALNDHPWRDWAGAAVGDERRMPGEDSQTRRMPGEDNQTHRMPGASSRWSGGKDLSWEPVRPERVAEVKYDHLQGNRFRHAAVFLRWRPDKPPGDCRYDQLEVAAPLELAKVFGVRP
ncbi:MAG TPA: ATP-dependent DNA ligase [Ramlibacter sp.]|uniref:ATP-dependent DNA ligase n=1 Tax=Ramlibacter sp. TaxID=1917967 RepID=UPI002C6D4C1F|nr:ATP-dependent DNA ligase [Ramlibacter sp.]HVZ43991.1 ATP-dependent DNA ligase [Ramlibacter sp.]